MKVFAFSFLCAISTLVFSQSKETTNLLLRHVNQNRESGEATIVDQFLDKCIYEAKCGHFATGAIHEFGLIKGFVLSVDRRLRCNSLTKRRTPRTFFNHKGKIIDHWLSYRVKVD